MTDTMVDAMNGWEGEEMEREAIAFWPPDYLDEFGSLLNYVAILEVRGDRQPWIWSDRVQPYRAAVQSVYELKTEWFDASDAAIRVGKANELTPKQAEQWMAALKTFCPWKKGPFELFGIPIDAEWRSDLKWERILPHIQPLAQRKVADIGCHNGYFMFRMLHENPELVIGFEPVAKHFWNFQLIQNLIQQPNLYFELLGVEHIDLYPNVFDTIFCLGILYHHADPIGLLRKLREALAPGGELIIDCQGIPGEEAIALTPRKRYAQAKGIWFLPTQSCLETWIARAGFTDIHCFYAEPLSLAEQRRTPWADIDSLKEFLNPNDLTRTIEGYPAPWRYYVRASK